MNPRNSISADFGRKVWTTVLRITTVIIHVRCHQKSLLKSTCEIANNRLWRPGSMEIGRSSISSQLFSAVLDTCSTTTVRSKRIVRASPSGSSRILSQLLPMPLPWLFLLRCHLRLKPISLPQSISPHKSSEGNQAAINNAMRMGGGYTGFNDSKERFYNVQLLLSRNVSIQTHADSRKPMGRKPEPKITYRTQYTKKTDTHYFVDSSYQ
eukprot:scaffold1669_cov129-Cylindrotheca_fusiformis.AAC.1